MRGTIFVPGICPNMRGTFSCLGNTSPKKTSSWWNIQVQNRFFSKFEIGTITGLRVMKQVNPIIFNIIFKVKLRYFFNINTKSECISRLPPNFNWGLQQFLSCNQPSGGYIFIIVRNIFVMGPRIRPKIKTAVKDVLNVQITCNLHQKSYKHAQFMTT